MLTPDMGNRLPDGVPWAADNACFSNPKAYSDERYLSWLRSRSRDADRCLFATAPDVVGNHAATLARSIPMFSRIRDEGYKPALVAQDGLTPEMVPWDDIDALFIGGSTPWKESEHAFVLCQEAKRRGKWVHMGRVNSRRRFELARSFGCDSVDGTLIAFGPRIHEPRVRAWMEEAKRAPQLWRD